MDSFDCIEVAKGESSAVIRFKDRRVMDPARIEKLGKELSVIASGDDQEMLIDFDNVNFISSAAISKLIVLEKKLRSNGKKLRLNNMQPTVRDLFSLAKLDTIFEIEES